MIETLVALISVRFLCIGGIIGWLYKEHLHRTYLPAVHPEMFDEKGNVIPDEVIAFRFENLDFLHEEIEEENEDD